MSWKPRLQADKDHDRDNVIHIQHPDRCADERADDRDRHDGEDWTDVRPPLMLPSPSAPMQVPRAFVRHSLLVDGIPDAPTLRYWRGGWWVWRTTHWAEVENRTVRSLLYAFTEHAVYADGMIKGAMRTKPWQPNRRKIGDLLEALSSITILPDDTHQPSWLDHRKRGTIIAVGNGLLDLVSRDLYPHTPRFFNQTCVPFAYGPHAAEPRQWLNFLDALWPQDADAINLLAEWCGYVISGRTDLHKIMLMVGPTRGGKGVIARVLRQLVGKENVAGPTLHSLSGDFGMAPLIGKPLAIISDARLSGKDGNIVVERLLSISGEDTLTVNRKYRDQWTGKLPSRLHVISNELPRLGDASAAIVGRIILLPLSRSWLGKEDYDLELRLHSELSGILNWCLDGLGRLTIDNRNRFTRLTAAEDMINVMRDLASPVAAFVREKCELGSNKEIEVGRLFEAFKLSCDANNYPKSPMPVFARDLRAAVASIRVRMPGTHHRVRLYTGIDLRSDAVEGDG
jgi:putative DNA primase/helicase